MQNLPMDFLMLLPGNRRVVLEVDGMQHFTRNCGTEPDSALRVGRSPVGAGGWPSAAALMGASPSAAVRHSADGPRPYPLPPAPAAAPPADEALRAPRNRSLPRQTGKSAAR